MRLLRDLAEKLAPRGVVTIGVFRDHSIEEMILPFIKEYGVPWPVARDPEGVLLPRLGITDSTHYAVVLLNPRGQVAKLAEGFGAIELADVEPMVEHMRENGGR